MTRIEPGGATAGILLYSLGIFFFSVNDALGKWLVTDYSAGQLMACRAAGACLVLAVIVWRSGTSLRLEGQYGLHLLRVLCSAADTFAFYYATRALPLADVMTFYMAGPLFVVALSGPFLGERIGLTRWLAVGIGFSGVLIALHPGQAAMSPSALIAIGGALLFAVSITVTRKLRATNWLTLSAYQVIGTGLAGSLTFSTGWTMPGAIDIGLMFAVGIVSMGCFMGLTKALTIAPASLLAPFQYASIGWAVLMGWAVWGDIPTPTTLAGVAVIVAGGFLALRSKHASAPA